MAIEEENDIIEITDEDGNVINCRLYDIVEVDGKQYAVMSENTEEEVEEDEIEFVLMRLIENGDSDEVFFETIDNDEEFEKVQAYIESLADDEDEYEE